MRFNPPPNWPRLPYGWSPPPGWQPDPSWPPPPYGWPLWVDDDGTSVSSSHPPAAPLPRQRSQPLRRQLPWYKRTVTVTLFLIFLFPVGLVLLWQRQDWTVRRRSIITGVVAVFVIIALAAPNPPPTTTLQATPAAGDGSAGPSPSPSPSTAAASPSVSATKASPSPSKSTAAAVAAAPTTAEAPPPPPPTTHSEAPPPPPTTQAAPQQPSTCGAPSNPDGYNFCGTGPYVTSPAGDICSYFNCIDNFWNGHGYMVECNDGMYSMSGGIRGACSYHSGEDRPVYSG